MTETHSIGSFEGHAARGRDDFTNEELLTVREAAQFLKVTVSWVYEHVRPEAEDRLPGRRWCSPPSSARRSMAIG